LNQNDKLLKEIKKIEKMNSSLIRQSKKDKESNINYKPLYEHMKAMLKANGRNVNYNLRK